jgi:hypothetical protein
MAPWSLVRQRAQRCSTAWLQCGVYCKLSWCLDLQASTNSLSQEWNHSHLWREAEGGKAFLKYLPGWSLGRLRIYKNMTDDALSTYVKVTFSACLWTHATQTVDFTGKNFKLQLTVLVCDWCPCKGSRKKDCWESEASLSYKRSFGQPETLWVKLCLIFWEWWVWSQLRIWEALSLNKPKEHRWLKSIKYEEITGSHVTNEEKWHHVY